MHTVARPPDETPQPHRPQYPPAHWAVIDAHEDRLGLPPWPLPL